MDGTWVKTGEQMSPRPNDALQEPSRVPDSIQQDQLQNMVERLDSDPHSLVGTSVYQRFNQDGMGYKTGSDDGTSDDPVAHGIVKDSKLHH
jgi:hypothetical protein